VSTFGKLAFRIGLGRFMLKPNLYSGVVFRLPEYNFDKEEIGQNNSVPSNYALQLGGGIDFTFSFPGDKISVFIGADVGAEFDVRDDLEDWVLLPSIRGGVIFYPFSKDSKEGKNIVAHEETVPVISQSSTAAETVNIDGMLDDIKAMQADVATIKEDLESLDL
jgi:hypothetical protein